MAKLEQGIQTADAAAAQAEADPSLESSTAYLADVGAKALADLRVVCDAVEREVDANEWKLPRYWEMLHLH
jgi:glutamine synthetase type III